MKILLALIKKEIKQILRDPSSIIIAFVLPLISILIYMYGINLDSVRVTMGVKMMIRILRLQLWLNLSDTANMSIQFILIICVILEPQLSALK